MVNFEIGGSVNGLGSRHSLLVRRDGKVMDETEKLSVQCGALGNIFACVIHKVTVAKFVFNKNSLNPLSFTCLYVRLLEMALTPELAES